MYVLCQSSDFYAHKELFLIKTSARVFKNYKDLTEFPDYPGFGRESVYSLSISNFPDLVAANPCQAFVFPGT